MDEKIDSSPAGAYTIFTLEDRQAEGGLRMDARAAALLHRIRAASIACFGENLTGVYVHGSLALGCFTWTQSDVDWIVLVRTPPSCAQKEAYISALLEMTREAPPKGLEMSVTEETYARNFVYPTPFELHFSNAHLPRCREDLRAYCREMHGTDVDLAAHFTVLRHAGRTLFGKPAAEAFGSVPPEAYWDSITRDVKDARREIVQNPVYTALNLCRVLAYQREGRILSKRAGGEWMIAHGDGRDAAVARRALDAYRGADAFTAADWEPLHAFASRALERIRCGLPEKREKKVGKST